VSSEKAGLRPEFPSDWRTRILDDPEIVLGDRDVMRALIRANDQQMGGNIVDMRGLAMDRLQDRLERLEDTHRSVIAAAYENLAGTNQVHRATLALLDHTDFKTFLVALGTEVASILRVDRLRLVLESSDGAEAGVAQKPGLSDVLTVVGPGFVDEYVTAGRDMARKQVTLRPIAGGLAYRVYGEEAAQWLRSEALIRIDLGPERLPALLAMGAEDPQQFRPNQGTDLLSFFGGAFERLMQRWLG
jgi:uncharacterized protein YigA (DUF484 family)